MSFVKVYFDFEERTEMLNEVEQGRLLLAILRYAQGKELPELKGGERFLFPVFKIDIHRDAATYNAKVSNGAKGGRPKQETEENQTKPNQTEDNLSAKNKNKKEEQEQEDISFDRFWSAYPHKVKKQDAQKAWRSAKLDKVADTIIADVKLRCETEWKGQDIHYIPHPTTYLHQRRWEDDTKPTARKDSEEPAQKVYTDADYENCW